MEKKVFRVMNTFDYKDENIIEHEYNVLIEKGIDGGTEYTLLRSHSDIWAKEYRGKALLTIINTGDGFIFPKKRYKEEVDYTSATELYILLHIMNNFDEMPLFRGEIEEFSIVNTITI